MTEFLVDTINSSFQLICELWTFLTGLNTCEGWPLFCHNLNSKDGERTGLGRCLMDMANPDGLQMMSICPSASLLGAASAGFGNNGVGLQTSRCQRYRTPALV